MRGRWLLIAGVGLAVLGGALTFAYLRSLDRRTPVVVAARDLPPRHQIGLGDVRLTYLHPEAVLSGSMRDSAAIQGNWVVEQIFAGEQVTAARTQLSLTEHCAWGLGATHRAMFVSAGFARAAGAAVRPGDRVDLVAVTTGYGEAMAYRLATNLRVLELRDERGLPIPAGPHKSLLGGVLLAVPDFLVESVALAASCGQVYLVLRDPLLFEQHIPGTEAGSEEGPQ